MLPVSIVPAVPADAVKVDANFLELTDSIAALDVSVETVSDAVTALDVRTTALEAAGPSSGTSIYNSVKDHGATGDGTTDDAAAINAAIAAGGTAFFPNGVYRLKSSIQFLAGVNLIGESMSGVTLKWHPDTDIAGSIIVTTNQSLSRAEFKNLRFIKDVSITASVTGILGGSTLANYNSAIACFENLHFDGVNYGIRGNAEPTGVGIFDCYFKNIWASSCFYGLWLFGSGNRIDHPRITYCDTGVVLDYLNAESCDGMTVTGGIFVHNNYDFGIPNASGIRPTTLIGTWFEQSTYGILNVNNMNTKVMNLTFQGCQLSTYATASLLNVYGALGTVSVDRCTLISGGSGKAQNFVTPLSASGRLVVSNCQKYNSSGVGSWV